MPPPNEGPASVSRTLSKSDFLLARDCAAKLYFRENGYPDKRDGNAYLRLLAEGGYMVEALAKARYPDGVPLDHGGDLTTDFARTMEALEASDVTLFDATLLVGRRQARIDILVKRGNVLRIIEVKAKSFDGAAHARQLAQGQSGAFRGSRRPYRILADWDKTLADATYQVVLLELCMPGRSIQPALGLVDTSKSAGLDDVLSWTAISLESELQWKRDMRAHDGARGGLPRSVARITKRKPNDCSAAQS